MSFGYGGYGWKPYVPVAMRRAKAERAIKKASKGGAAPQPVRIAGRAIAQSFWGKGWCQHLEAFSDFENRLPRGRGYVRNGSVCDLKIKPGRVESRVMGSSLYKVSVDIKPLKPAAWKALRTRCSGGIGSLLELLQGRLSDKVMRVVTDRRHGLFPLPGEMKFACSCPDWADMCKHVAATLYGVGNRLDQEPQLLFQLRGVDAAELIGEGLDLPGSAAQSSGGGLAPERLGSIFGIELDTGDASPGTPARPVARRPAKRRRHASAPKKDGRNAAPRSSKPRPK